MKIKPKLFTGIGLLFGMILLLTILSSLFVWRLASDTTNILVANYNTLNYSRNMLLALNNGIESPEQQELFRINLEKQQKNITETGEELLTNKLAGDFRYLLQSPSDSEKLRQVRSDLSDIMLLNMEAIQRKSTRATNTSDEAIFWISTTGTICFMIAFILLVNLPGNIADPIAELTASIKEIAARNYSKRVQFRGSSEFGELASSFNIMAQKLEEYQAGNLQQLMAEKTRIETLINNMKDPVIGLDNDQRLLFVNQSACLVMGLHADEIIGKSAQEIAIHNDLLRSLVRDLFSPAGESTGKRSDTVKIFADNKESYFRKEIIPIETIPTGEKEKQPAGNVIVLKNITQFEELDQAKTNFIATVSHELKTPLSSIQMSLQLLENEKLGVLNPEQQEMIHSIREDSERLLKITGELLNMTQLETGKIQLSIATVNPMDIIDWAIQANKQAADQKHIQVVVSKPGKLPSIAADIDKTAWVFNNLLSNAIRYSYEFSKIQIELEATDAFVKVAVVDNGRGIEPEYLEKIFTRYFKVPGASKQGTGLGLSISKEFIESQGGNISVISELGTGTKFEVWLPKA